MEERKELISQWAVNYSTILEYLAIGRFQSYKTGNKWVARRVHEGDLQEVGTIAFRSTGRPVKVYGAKMWKGLKLKHEVMTSKVLLPYFLRGMRFLRGYDVNPVLRPDAETPGEVPLFWQMDMGTESIPKVSKVLMPYADSPGVVLFVTTCEERVEAVLRASRDLADQLLCTTIEWVRAQPFGAIWKNVDGGMASLDF